MSSPSSYGTESARPSTNPFLSPRHTGISLRSQQLLQNQPTDTSPGQSQFSPPSDGSGWFGTNDVGRSPFTDTTTTSRVGAQEGSGFLIHDNPWAPASLDDDEPFDSPPSTRTEDATRRGDAFMHQMMPQRTGQPAGELSSEFVPPSIGVGEHGQQRTMLTGPPLPRRPPPTGHELATPGPPLPQRPDTTNHSSPLPELASTGKAPSEEQDTADDQTRAFRDHVRDMLKQAFESLIVAHEQEMFLLRSKSSDDAAKVQDPFHPLQLPQDSSSWRGAGASNEDALTRDFVKAFPSLSREGSPQPGHPSLASGQTGSFDAATEGPAQDPQSNQFRGKVSHLTDMLSWQLEKVVQDEVDRGSRAWREEKARGMQEVEEIERELSEAQEEADKVRAEKDKLEKAVQEQTGSHAMDLEAAARSAAELSDRVELLQIELNEQRRAVPSTATVGASQAQGDSADAWTEIINEQASAIEKYESAVRSLSGPLTCTVCTEILSQPTTLSCGHSGCLTCASDWIGRTGTCPSCRAVVDTGPGLSLNYALDSTVQVLKSTGIEDSGAR